ncbi:hypothetical protein N7476_009403 [Penicillium atrosanguineum]|uniref:Uncharacterized protein n=1 Tax=Penicillium atrosanguineum TaxID=1132637 RepID=A0A9W9PN87_9EURO|nr:hypothetical protein N7476_009403 [Penicillium atrosanguineum]
MYVDDRDANLKRADEIVLGVLIALDADATVTVVFTIGVAFAQEGDVDQSVGALEILTLGARALGAEELSVAENLQGLIKVTDEGLSAAIISVLNPRDITLAEVLHGDTDITNEVEVVVVGLSGNALDVVSLFPELIFGLVGLLPDGVLGVFVNTFSLSILDANDIPIVQNVGTDTNITNQTLMRASVFSTGRITISEGKNTSANITGHTTLV